MQCFSDGGHRHGRGRYRKVLDSAEGHKEDKAVVDYNTSDKFNYKRLVS